MFSRHQTLQSICLVFCGLMAFVTSVALSAEKYKLEEPVDDARVFGVGTRVEIKGTLRFPKNPDLRQTVSAALSYRERRLLGPGDDAESLRSAREYETAEADITVGETKTAMRLPENLKLIVAQGRIEGVELYGLNGLLTGDELNLIRSPADSLALIALLPAKEVEISDQWSVPGWAFQMLTSLDAIVKGELVCTLASVEKGMARVKMAGTLEGATVGSMTEVKVSGYFTYHIQGKYIADTDFVQTEARAIGPVSPGFEISARIRLLRQPAKVPGRLSDAKIIDAAAMEPAEAAKSLRFDSPWNISLQHGRQWHECTIDEKIAIFRLMEEGNFIAECALASISPAKPGEHLSEQTFQSDIRRSLGDRFRTMSKGDVIPASGRKFVYQVTAEGVEGERQVTWVFYLIADPTGRQASLRFVVDTAMYEKLMKNDREFVDSIKFGPAPASAQRAANK
jgi:hypothetical protein